MTTCGCATRSLWRRSIRGLPRRSRVRGVAGGRAIAAIAAAADVHAAAAARAVAAQPRGRLADGHVLGRRRDAERLPSRASRRAVTGRRGAGDDRDDLRLGCRPDHAGVRRDVLRRARRGVEADRLLCARLRWVRDRRADRPLRPQGLDEADVGGDRRAAAVGQLAGDRALADPVQRRATRCRAR